MSSDLRSTFALPSSSTPEEAGTVFLYRARLEAELAAQARHGTAPPSAAARYPPGCAAGGYPSGPATAYLAVPAAGRGASAAWTAVAVVIAVAVLAAAVVVASLL